MNIYMDAAIAGAPERHGELAGKSERSPAADWHENSDGDFRVLHSAYLHLGNKYYCTPGRDPK